MARRCGFCWYGKRFVRWLHLQPDRVAIPAAPGSVVLLALVILSLVLGARLARLDQRLTVDNPDARRALVGFMMSSATRPICFAGRARRRRCSCLASMGARRR